MRRFAQDDESVGRTNRTETFVREPGRTAGPSATPPRIPGRFVALVNFMRLPLQEAAHLAVGECRPADEKHPKQSSFYGFSTSAAPTEMTRHAAIDCFR